MVEQFFLCLLQLQAFASIENLWYLQASNLFSKTLFLLGHDALVELSVSLHDAVLGCQDGHRFLKIKILTRERQPQSNTQAYKHTHTQWQGTPQRGTAANSNHKWHHRSQSQGGTSSQMCANTSQACVKTCTHTHKGTSANTIDNTRDAERREDERENRTGNECLTARQKLLHLHQLLWTVWKQFVYVGRCKSDQWLSVIINLMIGTGDWMK